MRTSDLTKSKTNIKYINTSCNIKHQIYKHAMYHHICKQAMARYIHIRICTSLYLYANAHTHLCHIRTSDFIPSNPIASVLLGMKSVVRIFHTKQSNCVCIARYEICCPYMAVIEMKASCHTYKQDAKHIYKSRHT